MALAFSKWEGLGNDFVLLSALEGLPPDPGALARALCHRHFGIGADGLVLLTRGPGLGLGMEILNPDGSLAAMCGNGLRCLAAFARREGRAPAGEVVFATRSGPRSTKVLSEAPWRVQVDMGEPTELEPPSRLALGGREFPSACLSMGNPHRVLVVDRVDRVPLEEWGLALEPSWPGGINVGFVEVRSPRHLVVRVWERGAGATMACGTGACAALAAASRAGLCEREARVELPGGALDLSWGPDGRIRMTGPARELFQGSWNPDPP